MAITVGILAVVLFGGYSATVKVDFPVYHTAGALVLQGDPRLYPEGVADEGPLPTTHYFRAAPLVAWLFVPFALVPIEVASFVFFMLKVTGLVGIVAMVTRQMRVPLARGWFIGLGALVATGGYVVEEMRYGNAHLLVLAGMVCALYLIQQGRVVLPAILLALSSAIKVTPLLLVVYLAVTGRLKVALATLGVLLALLAAPAVLVGARANGELLRSFAASAGRMADQPRNHSLRGVIVRYLTTAVPEAPDYPRVSLLNLSRAQATAVWLIGAAVIAGLMLWAVRRRRQSADAVLLEGSLVILAMLILSTHTQRIYFSALFFPFCVLIALLVRSPAVAYGRAIRRVIGASVILGTVLPLVLPGRRLSLAYEMGSPYLFVTVAAFGLFLFLLRHSDDDSVGRR